MRLRYQLAVTAASQYCQAGFTVVYQDVIVGPVLGEVVDMLRGVWPLHAIVLAPSVEAVARREAGRAKTGYGAWSPEALDAELRAGTPHLGLWLDTSDLTVEATVDAILRRLGEAAIR